jgi:hypothetical protein
LLASQNLLGRRLHLSPAEKAVVKRASVLPVVVVDAVADVDVAVASEVLLERAPRARL